MTKAQQWAQLPSVVDNTTNARSLAQDGFARIVAFTPDQAQRGG
ncbi:hypothetical protein [uncultured Deinococcus sp.]|nr:hypothetical protein [uncultured Deinococcus sp.]